MFSCCTAEDSTAALSCLDSPNAYFGNYCPAPPELNIEDTEETATGPLDSDNTFIAEYLVRVAADVQPSVFFQQVQAGFVVSYQEPAISFCPTSSSVSQELSGLIKILYHNISEYNTSSECEEHFETCADDVSCDCSNPFGCTHACVDALGCVDGTLPNGPNSTLPGNYYKGVSACLQESLEQILCYGDALGTSKSVAQIHPVQDITTTVTVWYNNQVSKSEPDVSKHEKEILKLLKYTFMLSFW